MISNRIYYSLKPYLPSSVRFAARRWIANRRRPLYSSTWPIMESASPRPENWRGWPEGKKFAFILTHDVEGLTGLANCQKLAELEKNAGFRSSFNFIPKGDYRVPRELRDELVKNGFEVGVHDLYHDGKLYDSKPQFEKYAEEINEYLRDWNSVGFRSGFMLRNLEWIHSLNIRYDSSTFDTDPFEPQPDGVDTIFPFWVNGGNGKGYVELPYTLPQDSTLFLILREDSNEIWKRKLDWIAAKGGMALVNVHPDYLRFDGERSSIKTFPSRFYGEFLKYVGEKYAGQYWNALPREVADYTVKMTPTGSQAKPMQSKQKTIWIDLDNTPHVPFFEPIIKELSRRGYKVLVTARDAFQVCALADKKGVSYIKVGRHHGKNRIRKFLGLFVRACQLAPMVLRYKPALSVSHGSRAQIISSNFFRVPSLLIADYEYARMLPLMHPTWEMVPDVIPDSVLPCRPDQILKYPGIKEDVYVPGFVPDPALKAELGLDSDKIIVTARPPASEAHYHRPESDVLFTRFMEKACKDPNVKVVMLPRNTKQGETLRQEHPHWFANNKTIIPKNAVDGLNLLWYSDLVVSGGGTMNREAAALGIPVYSVFRGTIGAVDHYLAKEGKMVLLESEKDVDTNLLFRKRTVADVGENTGSPALLSIVNAIEKMVASK